MTKTLEEDFRKEMDDFMKTVFSLLKDTSDILKKERKNKIEIAEQNAMLRGFIKIKSLDMEYAEFSRLYQEWDINEFGK